ncbi:ABC-2 family transporter protein [Deinococcus sp. KNUC1210]|uniref:ABC transporter permease n=1 Tax=Deinococcus sp. KNUC1210 TaxID=2917691 RepID=UPI001EF0C006|nr:ABC-2 family transporter protein [Deinococcus sp. KNUC1210]ULH15507.1 ABC-2 family transporter protein [Deinococcus sp. KNUC1210]
MRAEIRLFWEVARRSFARQLTYRRAAIAGLLTNLFFGVLRMSVLLALLRGRGLIVGFSASDAVTYTGITQALIMMMSLFGWFDLMNTVYRGEVGSDLLRPYSYFGFWLAGDAGRAAAQFLMRAVPILVLYAALFGLKPPQSVGTGLLVVLSTLLAWFVSFSFRFLINLTAFWSPNAIGMGRLAFTVLMFASGFLLPLTLFPAWVQTLCSLTPFPSMLQSVVDLWTGKVGGWMHYGSWRCRRAGA